MNTRSYCIPPTPTYASPLRLELAELPNSEDPMMKVSLPQAKIMSAMNIILDDSPVVH
jgi:hypothetical protein